MKKDLIQYYETRDFDSTIPAYDVNHEAQKYPTAVFIMAKCTSSNPLRVMYAQPHQIEEHLSDLFLWNRKSQNWDQKDDAFAHEIPSYKLKKMSIRYIHLLDKNQNMVFCIDL